jgi:hypothetical protein
MISSLPRYSLAGVGGTREGRLIIMLHAGMDMHILRRRLQEETKGGNEGKGRKEGKNKAENRIARTANLSRQAQVRETGRFLRGPLFDRPNICILIMMMFANVQNMLLYTGD